MVNFGKCVQNPTGWPAVAGHDNYVLRATAGSFRKVSAKDLPLFVAEFQFRYNNRKNTDIFGTAISGF